MRWEVTGIKRETGRRHVHVLFAGTHAAAVQAAAEQHNLEVEAAVARDVGVGGDAASTALWSVRALLAGQALTRVAQAIFVLAILLMISGFVPLVGSIASESGGPLLFAAALVVAALSLVVLSYASTPSAA